MDQTKSAYYPLMSGESVSDDASSSDGNDIPMRHQQWNSGRQASNLIRVLLGLVITLALLVLSLVILVSSKKPTDQQCAAQLSVYSPAIEAVEYVQVDFSDAFNSTSIYRGPPTPEREDAWETLTYKHAIEIPMDKISGLNRSEKDNLKHVPEDVGTGYVALLEVYHQLHCLNLIRKYTWFQTGHYPELDPTKGLVNSSLTNRMHVDHCLEALRISIMCFGDVTPLLVRNDPHHPDSGKADFDTHHMCRNFDKIDEWIDENWTVW